MGGIYGKDYSFHAVFEREERGKICRSSSKKSAVPVAILRLVAADTVFFVFLPGVMDYDLRLKTLLGSPRWDSGVPIGVILDSIYR